MRSKTYIINHQPVPWSRPKLCGQRFFDGQIEDKLHFKISVESQHNDEPLYTRPIAVELEFYFKLPNEATKKPDKYKYHQIRPDVDNCIKFVLDAISNDVLIKDDKIVYAITAIKKYDSEARTVLTIKEV